MDTQKKIHISIAVFLTIGILFLASAAVLIIRSIQKNSEEFVSQKKELISVQKEIETFTEAKSRYESSKESIDKIDKLFIDPENPIDFLNFLNKNAESHNLKIKTSPLSSGSKEIDPWPSISFQVSSSGSFSNSMKFLRTLELSPYLIEMSTTNIKNLTEGEIGAKGLGMSLDNVNANFLMKVYTK